MPRKVATSFLTTFAVVIFLITIPVINYAIALFGGVFIFGFATSAVLSLITPDHKLASALGFVASIGALLYFLPRFIDVASDISNWYPRFLI